MARREPSGGFARYIGMTRYKLLPASSLALLLALIFGSANAQDATFDVEADDPAVEAVLDAKEAELEDFFEEREIATIDQPDYEPVPTMTTREESVLLDRANQEATEFNDIDADDLALMDANRAAGAQPRLDKPGQVETDFPITCPLGTDAQDDGTCLAGPDYRFEDTER